MTIWMERHVKGRESKEEVKTRKIWIKKGRRPRFLAWKHGWIVLPKLVLRKPGQGNVLVETLKIALFLLLVNHCKVRE